MMRTAIKATRTPATPPAMAAAFDDETGAGTIATEDADAAEMETLRPASAKAKISVDKKEGDETTSTSAVASPTLDTRTLKDVLVMTAVAS